MRIDDFDWSRLDNSTFMYSESDSLPEIPSGWLWRVSRSKALFFSVHKYQVRLIDPYGKQWAKFGTNSLKASKVRKAAVMCIYHMGRLHNDSPTPKNTIPLGDYKNVQQD